MKEKDGKIQTEKSLDIPTDEWIDKKQGRKNNKQEDRLREEDGGGGEAEIWKGIGLNYNVNPS